MSKSLEDLKKLFPSSREIKITDRKFNVKPMVITDFLEVVESFGVVMQELSSKGVKLTEFDESKDFVFLLPVANQLVDIFAKWLEADAKWLKDNLTPKGIMKLLIEFMEVNEYAEVRDLFLELMLKVKEMGTS